MTRFITLAALLPVLTGCGLDKLENPEAKSDFQVMIESQQAAPKPIAPLVAAVAVHVTPKPVEVTPAVISAPVVVPLPPVEAAPVVVPLPPVVIPAAVVVPPAPPKPVCHDVFRVVRCIGDVAHDYDTGEPL